MAAFASVEAVGVMAAKEVQQAAAAVENARSMYASAHRPENYAQRAVEYARAEGRLEMAQQFFQDVTGEFCSPPAVAQWASKEV